MEDRFKDISVNNDLDFYLNVKNISNSNFVFDIIEYFESGLRKGVFEPLEFLNIFWKQYNLIKENVSKPFGILDHLQKIELSQEKKHILSFFILRYYYQYFDGFSHSSQEKVTLEIVRRFFLEYEQTSPEKIYFFAYINSDDFNFLKATDYKFTYLDFEDFTQKKGLDFFFNVSNIPNSDLVFSTYDYAVYGSRSGFIEPNLLLNLIEYFDNFIDENLEKPSYILETIKKIAKNDLVEHIILGFILKWHNGYPINLLQSFNYLTDQTITILKLIEKKFLAYPIDTPEKEYCKTISYNNQIPKEIESPQIFRAVYQSTSKVTQPKKDKKGEDKNNPSTAPPFVQELFKLYNDFKNKGTGKREIIGKIAIKVLGEEYKEIKQHFKTEKIESLKTEIRRNLQEFRFIEKESDLKR